MAIAKLTFSAFSLRKARVGLTVAAIALSVSLVVAVTSGFSSLHAAIFRYFTEFMGSTDVQVVRPGDSSAISESFVEAMRRESDVRSALGRLETETKMLDAEGKTPQGLEWRLASVVGITLPDDVEVGLLQMEPGTTGGWWCGDAGDVAVVDQEVVKLLKTQVGGYIVLPGVNKQLRLKVVGVVHKPAMMAQLRQYIYVPLPTLQRFLGAEGKVTRILIDLKPGADEDAFVARWTPRLKASDPQIVVKSARSSRKELDNNLQGAQMLSYLGGTVSMLAATFIVFSTLSMGVTERQRILAMLRAVGALKWQIGAVVVLEGVVLAAVGAIIGVPLGLLWVKILATWRGDLFYAGLAPSWGGIAFGTIGSLLTALAASFLPAWNAMRVNPIEGMTSQGAAGSARFPWRWGLVGLAMVCVDPCLMFLPGVPRSLIFYGHFILGLPCLMVGFFLMAPVVVWVIEMVLAPIVAAALRVKHALLAQQLTGSVWRAAGTGAALMVGLAILVVMQTQGNTLLSGWRLPNRFPDMFIFAPFGLTPQQAKALETVPGVKPDEVLSIGFGVAGLPRGYLSIAGAAMLPDATLFLGVDPEKALSMIELDFREGNPKDAVRMMKQGRHVLVTEEFRQLKGLGVGDKIKLKTPNSGDVDYTIAGVVWSPGIDVFVAQFDMGRQFEQRSAGTVFGSMEDARRDFGVDKVSLFAANLQVGIEREELVKRVSSALGAWGLRAGDVRHIKKHIEDGFHRLLLLLSTVALSAIVVAALGVTNTILASIRSRRWQLGILRSVGMTRWQLVRLIFGEAILLGLVGCALGVAAGLEMSVNANGLSRRMLGYAPAIQVPWHMVGWGLVLIMGVTLASSIWPAVSASREEPLSLLQAGRAAS